MGRKKSLRNFLYIILGGILVTILYLEYQRLYEGFQEPKTYSIFATVSNSGNTIKFNDKSDDYVALKSMGVNFSAGGNIISITKLNASLGTLTNIDVYSRKGANPYEAIKERYVDVPNQSVINFYANGKPTAFIRKPPVEGKQLQTTSNQIILPKAVGPGGQIQSIHITGLKGSNIQLGKVPDKTDIQIILTF
jgi:hypothetical protein